MSEEVSVFPEVPAPQSADDINELGRRLGTVQRKKMQTAVRKASRIASVSKPFDDALKSLGDEEDAILDAIINYAIGHKAELVEGKSQSIKLSSIELQWKLDGKGSLVFIAEEEDVIAKLKRIKNGRDFILVKETVKKDPVKADPIILGKLRGMVRVDYGESITVTTLPSPAAAKRGAKKIATSRPI